MKSEKVDSNFVLIKEEYHEEPFTLNCDIKNEPLNKITPKCETNNNAAPDHVTAKKYPNIDETKIHKCLQCAFSTRHKNSLKRHVNTKHTNRERLASLQCPHCLYNAKSKYWYNRHQMTHLSNRRLPYTAKKSCLLEKHLIRKHTKPEHDNNEGSNKVVDYIFKYKCEWCSFKSNGKGDFTKHKLSKHTDPGKINWQKCPHCPYQAQIKANLRRHIASKHTAFDDITWSQCSHCPYKAKTMELFKKHVICAHSDNPPLFQCPHCAFATKRKHRLDNHVIRHHVAPEQIDWIQCDHCDFKAKTKENLQVHVHFKHGNNRQRCQKCPFTAKRNKALKRHLDREHTNIQWYRCELCAFKATQEIHLRRHVSSRHTLQEKEYLQCPDCPFKTQDSEEYIRHLSYKSMDDAKAYRCEHCCYKATQCHKLEKHVSRLHTTSEQLQCERCDYEGKTKDQCKKEVDVGCEDMVCGGIKTESENSLDGENECGEMIDDIKVERGDSLEDALCGEEKYRDMMDGGIKIESKDNLQETVSS